MTTPAAPPPFTLRQLAYFVTAADAGTIARAAEVLHVSPSALSDAITELEATTGERLCVRRRAHGITLTSAGLRLTAHARLLLSQADELARSMEGTGTELSGPIVIGCYPTLAPLILPPILQHFAEHHPEVELSIQEENQDQLASSLASGRIDVAFVYDMLVPGQPSRLPLFALQAHAILSAEHPLAQRDAVRLEDLVDEDLILLDAPPSSAHTLSLFSDRGLHPHIRHRTASYELVRTLVARRLGYGILVTRVANPRSYEGIALVERDLDPPVAPVAVEVIWSPDRPLPRRTRALIEFARDHDWAGSRSAENPNSARAAAARPR